MREEPIKKNQWGKRCVICDGWVDAGEGKIEGKDVRHIGPCPPKAVEPDQNRRSGNCRYCFERLEPGEGLIGEENGEFFAYHRPGSNAECDDIRKKRTDWANRDAVRRRRAMLTNDQRIEGQRQLLQAVAEMYSVSGLDRHYAMGLVELYGSHQPLRPAGGWTEAHLVGWARSGFPEMPRFWACEVAWDIRYSGPTDTVEKVRQGLRDCPPKDVGTDILARLEQLHPEEFTFVLDNKAGFVLLTKDQEQRWIESADQKHLRTVPGDVQPGQYEWYWNPMWRVA